MVFMQAVHLDVRDGSSSVVLFQANNGSPVMRFSNATHVCLLNSLSMSVEDEDDDGVDCAFAVVRLVETGGLSSADGRGENDDMFTDISMETSASLPFNSTATALLVMHDLAVSATPRTAAASALVPTPTLPIPKVLPPASYKFVFAHNSRLRHGREASSISSLHFICSISSLHFIFVVSMFIHSLFCPFF